MREMDQRVSNKRGESDQDRIKKKKELLNKWLLLEHAQVNIWEKILLPEHDSFTEYLFAVTQFAFVTCFSVILPLTPLIVLFNHLINMRLDAYKLCRGRRHPLAPKNWWNRSVVPGASHCYCHCNPDELLAHGPNKLSVHLACAAHW